MLGFLLGGLIILGFFVFVELDLARREKQPLLDLRLFANGPFLLSNITNVLITFAFFGGLFLFPVYLQNLRGLNAFSAGLLLLPQAFASIMTALVGGRVVDRFGVRRGSSALSPSSRRMGGFRSSSSYAALGSV